MGSFSRDAEILSPTVRKGKQFLASPSRVTTGLVPGGTRTGVECCVPPRMNWSQRVARVENWATRLEARSSGAGSALLRPKFSISQRKATAATEFEPWEPKEWVLANLAWAARSVHARIQSENAPGEAALLASDGSRPPRSVRELHAVLGGAFR
jgi:hypothetical protein